MWLKSGVPSICFHELLHLSTSGNMHPFMWYPARMAGLPIAWASNFTLWMFAYRLQPGARTFWQHTTTVEECC